MYRTPETMGGSSGGSELRILEVGPEENFGEKSGFIEKSKNRLSRAPADF